MQEGCNVTRAVGWGTQCRKGSQGFTRVDSFHTQAQQCARLSTREAAIRQCRKLHTWGGSCQTAQGAHMVSQAHLEGGGEEVCLALEGLQGKENDQAPEKVDSIPVCVHACIWQWCVC